MSSSTSDYPLNVLIHSFLFGGMSDQCIIIILKSSNLPKQLLNFLLYVVKNLPKPKPNFIKILEDAGADDSMTSEVAKTIMSMYDIYHGFTMHWIPKEKRKENPKRVPKTFLETKDIYTKSEFHAWLIKHHPDRGGNEQEFMSVLKVGRSTFG